MLGFNLINTERMLVFRVAAVKISSQLRIMVRFPMMNSIADKAFFI
jgi:hypothetical protein